MNFDFSKARMMHVNWKTKLRNFLDGKAPLTSQEAASHRDCELGKWIYSVGLKSYGSVPQMQKLEQAHQRLHSIIREVVEHGNLGKKDIAETAYRKVDPVSNEIITLLTAVERAVASAPVA